MSTLVPMAMWRVSAASQASSASGSYITSGM